MNRINGLFSGCILVLAASGCSALTQWPDVNDNTATKGGAGGSGGKGEAGGSATKGGTSNRGGTTSLGGTSAAGNATTGGIANNAEGSSSSGGATNVGGTMSTSGGATNVAGTTSNGGTVAQGGGVGAATGGTGSNPSGGQGGATAGKGGTTATSGGTTASAAGGVTAQGGASGTSTGAGTGGVASSLAIATPALPTGKTGVTYTAVVTASGAATYTWSIASGTLPSGVTLQSTTAASVTIAGMPKEAGVFPLTLSVTDGTATKTIDVSLAVTHKVAFLADRITSGVKELFLAEVGTETAGTPVRLSAPLVSGGVTSFAWSSDGAKVAYLLTQGGELRITSSTTGTGDTVAPNVVGYKWLSGGQFLAYYSSAGGAYVADVSGTTWTTQSVPLPAIPASNTRTFMSLIASPRTREFAYSYIDLPVDASGNPAGSPAFFSKFFSWTGTSTFTMATLRENVQSGAPSIAFSSDGTLVSTAASDGGLQVHDVTAPSSPTPYIVEGSQAMEYTWSTTTRRLLSQTRTLLAGLSLHVFPPGSHQATLLTDPSCNVAPGPWSPNGNHVLYACSEELRGFASVSSASVNTDFPLLPSGFLLNGFTNIPTSGWSPDSQWVAFRADRDADSQFDFFLIRWSSPGTATRPYSASTAPGVSTWKFAPNSSSVAFVGAIGTSTTPELYLAMLPTTGTPSIASPLTTATAPAVQSDIAWLPGSRVILYRANDTSGAQLHAVHLSPTGTSSTSISVSGASGTGVPSYQPAPLP